ncbi:unnamed protein product, partial [Cylicostephanus goldi]
MEVEADLRPILGPALVRLDPMRIKQLQSPVVYKAIDDLAKLSAQCMQVRAPLTSCEKLGEECQPSSWLCKSWKEKAVSLRFRDANVRRGGAGGSVELAGVVEDAAGNEGVVAVGAAGTVDRPVGTVGSVTVGSVGTVGSVTVGSVGTVGSVTVGPEMGVDPLGPVSSVSYDPDPPAPPFPPPDPAPDPGPDPDPDPDPAAGVAGVVAVGAAGTVDR